MRDLRNLEVRTRIDRDGHLRIWLEDVLVQEPGRDEVLVRMDAAPPSPSDQLLLRGLVEAGTLKKRGTARRTVIQGRVPLERRAAIAGRLGQSLPVGNKRADTVVAAGPDMMSCVGSLPALRDRTETFCRYQTVKAADSNADDFRSTLETALDEALSTLAYDAIGGGATTGTLLSAMETVASRRLASYSR